MATAENEDELVELALDATAAQLERIVRGYRGAASADVERANVVDADRHLTCTWDDDGALVLRGRLSADEGALFLRALEAGRDGVTADPDPARDAGPGSGPDVSAETSREPEPGRSNADALVAVADSMLAAPEVARSGGDRYQVVVHTDAAGLSGEHGGRNELESGHAVPSQTARRAACDAAVVAMTERDGQPLTVGRRTRTIPPAIRRALRSRDRCCRFPGCTQHRFVDAHHIHHWADGGATKLSNLVLLCRRHHRLLHEGGFGIERRGGGSLAFRRPDGRIVPTGPIRLRSGPEELCRHNRAGAVVVWPETAAARSGGDRFSLDMAVEALLARDGPLGVSGPAPA